MTDAREIEGKVPGTWIWGDNTPLNYNPWRDGEPNLASQRRAVIKAPLGKMVDIDYIQQKSVLCEK